MPRQIVLLERININAITMVDSQSTDGEFTFSGKLQAPGLYRLHFSNQQYILLSTNGRDISITADWNDLAAYRVSAGTSSIELSHFINGLKNHLRDLNTMTIVIDTLTARNDKVQLKKAKLEQADINQKTSSYIEKYAMSTLYEPNAIFAANMLNKDDNGLFLTKFANSLKRRFPNTKLTKDYLQLID